MGKTRLSGGLVALLVFLMFAAPAHAAFPGENGKIAFETNRGGYSYQRFIYSMNSDGSGATRISPADTSAHEFPTWSPDGRLLALTSDTQGVPQLTLMNPDGTGETTVGPGSAGGDRDPAWSPDGKRISYWSCGGMEEGCFGIFTVNSDESPGPGCIPNVCFTGEGASPTSWSPDGTKIAFGALSVINIDGTNRQDLLTAGSSNGFDPNWSPNGQKIAFTSSRDGNYEVYVMNADGSGQTRLTNNPSLDGYPAWSPDGTKIVFASLRDELDPANCFNTSDGCNWEIYVMNANGSGQTNVSNNPALDVSPDWQPLHPGYARPKGATKLELRFVPAYKSCTSANASHGSPLAVNSCSPPVPASDFLTVGSPDANGAAANSAGLAVMRAICNPPAPGPVPPCSNSGDQGDEEFQISFTDVRQKATLLDYTGELEAKMTFRITDRWNGLCSGCPQPGTATDVPFSFAVPCVTTPSGSVGSTCSVTTTANAVLAGTARESKRSIWQVGQFELLDGGPDGDADTPAGNTLFAVQGLFTP